MQTTADQLKFCGREFTPEDVSLIQDVVGSCAGLSRFELAHTVCELLEWKRRNGRLKARECRDFLAQLENQGVLTLPDKKTCGSNTSRKSIQPAKEGQVHSELTGSVEDFFPLDVELVESRQQRQQFKDLLSRYHYLGYAMPFGARLQYLVHVNRPQREVVGCIQFSSPAWRMKARDQWIGWNDKRREAALQQIVNNSRFLVLACISNLASAMLSITMRRLSADWQRQYGVTPLLVETLVDRQRFHGGCYQAANWILLGETAGRGRMDKKNEPRADQVKTIWVYPLVKNAVGRLREGR